MPDLDQLQSSQPVFLVGATPTGVETFPAEIDQLNASLAPTNKGLLTRSLLVGKTAADVYVPVQVDALGNFVVTSLTGFGADFSFGDVTTAAITKVAVRRTAYNEQTVNATRSISSSSALDTAAGTGARSVRITYYTAAFAGPFTTTVTLNGTTAVNTSASDIAYIEDVVVVTAGSTGTNQGILTLFIGSGGAGGPIGTIAAQNGRTFWAHHYVPAGKECKITGLACSHNGTTVGSGGVFTLEALALGVANAASVQVSDFVRLYGQASTFSRTYQSPIIVPGPARLLVFVTPETASSTIYRGSIDFFEP